MKPILSLFFLSLCAAAPAVASQPADDNRLSFQGVFVDWSAATRESLEAERKGAAQPPPAATPGGPVSLAAPGSRALGERVGEIVATGDCADGERVARAAGDFALVVAVRDHCNARPAGER